MRPETGEVTLDHVEVDGRRIAFRRAGAGPVVVLLHGFVGDGLTTWSHQLEALSEDYTVLAWDAPGAGGSPDPPGWFRVSDYADCLAGFLRALGVHRAHVAGLSFGGAVALDLAERYPYLVTSLVLAGAYAGWRGSLEPDEVEDRLRYSLMAAELPPEEFVRAMLPSMFAGDPPEKTLAEFTASMLGFSPAGFRTMAQASAEADLSAGLAAITAPTLLLYGDRDERASLRVANKLLAAIPDSRLVVLPGVGHVSSAEAPAAFTREVRRFLDDELAPGGAVQ